MCLTSTQFRFLTKSMCDETRWKDLKDIRHNITYESNKRVNRCNTMHF